MRLIIAGSRDITDYELVKKEIEKAIEKIGQKPTEIGCGMARGVDECGYRWAKENGIKIKEFYAEWEKEGLSAGYKRNCRMGGWGQALIIVHHGTKGSTHMLNIARKQGLRIFETRI